MINKNLIKEYKQQAKEVDFAKVLISLDKDITKSGQFCCPFHNDKNPSAVISNKNNKGFCTVCAIEKNMDAFQFDTIDLVMKENNCNYYQAIEYILNLENINIEYEPVKKYDSNVDKDSSEIKNNINYILSKSKSINKHDLAYLENQRGLFIYDKYNLNGIRDVLIENNIEIKSNYYNNCNQLIYNFKYDEINHPVWEDEFEQFLIVKKRDNFENKDIPKARNIGTPYPKFIFTDKFKREVYICEGIEDALSMVQMGRNAISLNSVETVNKLIEIFEDVERLSFYKYIIATDMDKAGIKCKETLIEWFEENNYKYDTFKPLEIMFEQQGIKDVNELWKLKVETLKNK